MTQSLDTLKIDSMPKPEFKLEINLGTENSKSFNRNDDIDYTDSNGSKMYDAGTTIHFDKFGQNELNDKLLQKKMKHIKKTFEAINEIDGEEDSTNSSKYRTYVTTTSCEKKIKQLIEKDKQEDD